MVQFGHGSIREALDHSLRNAKHLRVRNSATVAAARKVADRLDSGDSKSEHVLFGTLLNYLVSLGLADPVARKSEAPVKKRERAVVPRDEVAAMRKKLSS